MDVQQSTLTRAHSSGQHLRTSVPGIVVRACIHGLSREVERMLASAHAALERALDGDGDAGQRRTAVEEAIGMLDEMPVSFTRPLEDHTLRLLVIAVCDSGSPTRLRVRDC